MKALVFVVLAALYVMTVNAEEQKVFFPTINRKSFSIHGPPQRSPTYNMFVAGDQTIVPPIAEVKPPGLRECVAACIL